MLSLQNTKKRLKGQRALHVASYMSSAKVAKVLVEHGADTNATTGVCDEGWIISQMCLP